MDIQFLKNANWKKTPNEKHVFHCFLNRFEFIMNYSKNFVFPIGAHLEYLVLTNSTDIFNSNYSKTAHGTQKDNKTNRDIQIQKEFLLREGKHGDGADYEEHSCCNRRGCWWAPPQASLAVAFCNETSIPGFRFMGQIKRHFTERLFWVIAFILSLSSAVYLIHGVWERYSSVPVIVTFQASSQTIDSIPFPAVTLCNMNKFPKGKVHELERIAKMPGHEKYQEAKQQLTFVRSVCNAQQSFAKQFGYAYQRGEGNQDADNNDTISEDTQDEMVDFLLEHTIPCDKLVRLCILGEEPRNCSDLFKPIITDYGKCCTFNILPLPLLLRNPQTSGSTNSSLYDNPVLGSQGKVYWPLGELNEWSKWKYDDGFVLPTNLNRPWKQRRAGLPYGLSILVDPNTEEYYCPVSDSEGIRFILHTPLEMPHVMEFASLADLNKEILIEVHPEMTNAQDDIRFVQQEKRKCYFGSERQLKFFGPYTGGNCVDECTAIILGDNCSCTFFFMPRDDGVRICNNEPESEDFKCIEQARSKPVLPMRCLNETLKDKCGHCDSLCEDIAYNYETTMADLQDATKLWKDQNPEHLGPNPPYWANHKMAVIHIFFGSDTTVPKYRKPLYGTTDLIANTGGILGLCLGFSVLSAVEVLYFLTLRSFWKYCRRRMIGRRMAHRLAKVFRSRHRDRNKVVQVYPHTVPVYPNHHNGYIVVNQPEMQRFMAS